MRQPKTTSSSFSKYSVKNKFYGIIYTKKQNRVLLKSKARLTLDADDLAVIKADYDHLNTCDYSKSDVLELIKYKYSIENTDFLLDERLKD